MTDHYGHQMAENPSINPLNVQRYLGHKNAKSTEVYIREAGRDFKRLGELSLKLVFAEYNKSHCIYI